MSAIDTIVFDLGNVLIPWDPRRLYRSLIADEKEMEYFLAEVCHGAWNARQDAGLSRDEAIAERIAAFPQYTDCINAFRDRWEDMLGDPIEGSVRLLHEVKANGYRALALTNWSAETFPLARKRFPFLAEFEGIVISGEEKIIKPQAEIYHCLFKRHGVAPERAVFMDDSLHNVEGARAVGMHAIHFTTPERARADLIALGVKLKPETGAQPA
jgi:2-haloacid dehalogenase